ncbi:MAG: hypothetical protein R2715_10155 [Ilumatobacteraceae bacterium]
MVAAGFGAFGLVAGSLAMAMPAGASGAAPGATLNDSGANFESSIAVDGNDVTITIDAYGVAPNLPHAQHIHIPAEGTAVCPTPASDTNDDGVVTTLEGVPSYGGVQLSLTTSGDTTPASALAVDRFPVADANGHYEYQRTITVSPELAQRIAHGAVVVHGVDFDSSGTYDGTAKSSLDPNLPLEATVPAACGEIQTQSFQASVTGASVNSSGTTFDGVVQVDGKMATVTLNVQGAAANLPHAQHIHLAPGTKSTCPDPSDDLVANGGNGDGLIQVLEAADKYGGIQASLTTTGDTSPSSALAVSRFPTASGGGSYTYVRSFEVTPELADQIANGAVVVHGVDVDASNAYDGVPSQLDATLPQEATLPAACGQITATSFTASAVGTSLNDSGSWFDSAISLDGNELTVQIHAYGMAPELPHAQHLHLEFGTTSRCPTAADDTNADGIVTTVEGVPAYGSVKLSLTTSGDSSPSSALAVDRFPVADANGEYVYERTFTLDPQFAANVTNAAVVLHGVTSTTAVRTTDRPSAPGPEPPARGHRPGRLRHRLAAERLHRRSAVEDPGHPQRHRHHHHDPGGSG